MKIQPIEPVHYSEIGEIYRQGIDTGMATFQSDVPSWEDWNNSHLSNCRIAVFENDIMTGWAALTPLSGRCVYAGVAEVSVYIHEDHRGKGIGKLLLEKLIEHSEKDGIWTLQSGIFPDNVASIRLHEACGFRTVGYREKIGRHNGMWRDTVLMERRSNKIG